MQGTTVMMQDKVVKVMPDVVTIREPKHEDQEITSHVEPANQEQQADQQ